MSRRLLLIMISVTMVIAQPGEINNISSDLCRPTSKSVNSTPLLDVPYFKQFIL